jgi:hypothetical protein
MEAIAEEGPLVLEDCSHDVRPSSFGTHDVMEALRQLLVRVTP